MVVVKANLEPILYRIKEYASDYMVVGYDGVVFAASRGEWVYNTLYPLAETQRLAIHESRRYPRTSLVSLSTESLDSIFHSDQALQIPLVNALFDTTKKMWGRGGHDFRTHCRSRADRACQSQSRAARLQNSAQPSI